MLPNETGDEFRFVSGAVCFPMKWSLREKIGMTTEQIHVPVPLYHEKIVHQVDSFMSGLKVGRPYWRANWNINDDPTLYRPLTEVTSTAWCTLCLCRVWCGLCCLCVVCPVLLGCGVPYAALESDFLCVVRARGLPR